ncbi:gamma-glutamyltransferase [Vibrio astriarenae]|uniref:Glutathione hydrolase proenzyme n=1 Tax=Vibrio astriarenae TaxID=1481923 RepID=A0A7Z2T2X7_9VIBR|nr:gamma-glutamyltransferase [Vibrio astriarenae]QIA63188.1 gamma-glutamyltransferase [Vibrio astriarenae]
MKKTALLATFTLCGFSVWASTQVSDSVAPEATSQVVTKKAVMTNKYMVAAAHPEAVKAGYEVLKRGGTAVDAMVAVQTVLGLVEPQSSGIGGGGFVVYFDAESKQLTTFDGRETAPLAARPELFQDKNGKPLKFFDAVVGGRSVATPGTVKLLEAMHQQYGKEKWSELFVPAINLATDGFTVSERMAASIARDQKYLARYPETKQYFMDKNGAPLQEGHLLENGAYANTLKAIAEGGADAFYYGEIAKAIVNKVNSVEDNPGVLALEDFATYKVIERDVVCAPYHQYEVCGMGPPSSGALTVGQTLGMLEHFDIAAMGPYSAKAWQIIGDASRLAFADRGRYIADTDYVPMPSGLLDQDYLKQRAELITEGKALSQVSAGMPRWEQSIAQADDQSIELPSTTHIVIADQYGNVLSKTSTVENGFGSRLMSNGFILNNELTDFSFASHSNGYPIANRVEPGKRPRSSMAPTIVMKEGKPYMAIGSPGGSQIIGYVLKTLIAHIDWKLDIQQAIDYPNMVNRFGTFDIEINTTATDLISELEKMGFETNVRDLNSGLHGIVFEESQMIGGADPRREGIVLGD